MKRLLKKKKKRKMEKVKNVIDLIGFQTFDFILQWFAWIHRDTSSFFRVSL